jgi:hypothetical protein
MGKTFVTTEGLKNKKQGCGLSFPAEWRSSRFAAKGGILQVYAGVSTLYCYVRL